MKNSPILFLDEPTWALDGKSENSVREGLMKLMENRIVLIVTHKLSVFGIDDTTIENGASTVRDMLLRRK